MNQFRQPHNISVSFIIIWLTGIATILQQSSCKKLIEIDTPPTNISSKNVYSNDATAIAVLTGVYTNLSMKSLMSDGLTSISLLAGLSADELTLYSNVTDDRLSAYYKNALTINNLGYNNIWTSSYQTIYTLNSAIEGLNNTSSLTPNVKQQLLGEAKFLRAFHYFYLVNLWGEVPLVLSTNYSVTAKLSRAPIADIYQQIIADLKEAQDLLSEDYLSASLLDPTSERVRPTKWVATALLARVRLYNGDWIQAEAEATLVINNASLYSLLETNSVFFANNREAIWQLQPVNSGWNTEEARLFIIPSTGPGFEWPVYLSDNLIVKFEDGDLRKINWTGKYTLDLDPVVDLLYPYKYKSATLDNPITEYSVIFRLAEQYLIRAEARAQQGNLIEAATDLNKIRNRAGLSNTTAQTQAELLMAILHERQIEFFAEWGHRWLDLKRTNHIEEVMTKVTQQKGGVWSSNWKLYPIPAEELNRAPNLTQNAGY